MLADLYSILFILFSGKEKKRDFEWRARRSESTTPRDC
jgi:hypothetical protein